MKTEMTTRELKLALDAGLINYIDHETPRVYFINGNADMEEVINFMRLIQRDEMLKNTCYEILKKILGKDDLVEKWWTIENKGLDNNRPADIIDEDPERIYNYLMAFAGGIYK